MLSDEEKKAIDVIKSLGISIHNGKSQIISGDTTKEISTAIYTTINLIEKQSKEIEELKKQKYLLNAKTGEITRLDNTSDYISKDKIEIRKEEKENCKDSIEEKYLLREIYILQSLLKDGGANLWW